MWFLSVELMGQYGGLPLYHSIGGSPRAQAAQIERSGAPKALTPIATCAMIVSDLRFHGWMISAREHLGRWPGSPKGHPVQKHRGWRVISQAKRSRWDSTLESRRRGQEGRAVAPTGQFPAHAAKISQVSRTEGIGHVSHAIPAWFLFCLWVTQLCLWLAPERRREEQMG